MDREHEATTGAKLLSPILLQGHAPCFHPDTMMHLRVPHRLFPDEHPSLPRLVQLVLCDDGWARIDAYRVSSIQRSLFRLLICPLDVHILYVHFKMAYEHVYGIKLDERETEAHIRRKAATQQRLRSFPPRYAHGLKFSGWPSGDVRSPNKYP